MFKPSIPGGRGAVLDLPYNETERVWESDLDKREFDCPRGDSHAAVMDVHPPSHFLPEFLVDIFQETIEATSDDMSEFGTAYLMDIILEELPETVVSEDVSEDGELSVDTVWVTDFDSRRLHETIVELAVELMEHAVSHADDDDVASGLESEML